MEATFQKILCPIDFSRISNAAIELAAMLAAQNHATVFLLAVIPTPDSNQSQSELERAATDQLRGIARKWFEGHTRFELAVRTGEPPAAILKAEQDLQIDAVVMATNGRTGAEYTRLGSVTERVVRESTCPVVTIRPRP
jgi:nucleotide-binding universal stress UspA family protein